MQTQGIGFRVNAKMRVLQQGCHVMCLSARRSSLAASWQGDGSTREVDSVIRVHTPEGKHNTGSAQTRAQTCTHTFQNGVPLSHICAAVVASISRCVRVCVWHQMCEPVHAYSVCTRIHGQHTQLMHALRAPRLTFHRCPPPPLPLATVCSRLVQAATLEPLGWQQGFERAAQQGSAA